MIVIFIRKELFYPMELPDEQCNPSTLAEHAEGNPGTLRIEDVKGNVLWIDKKELQ